MENDILFLPTQVLTIRLEPLMEIKIKNIDFPGSKSEGKLLKRRILGNFMRLLIFGITIWGGARNIMNHLIKKVKVILSYY
eukprot:snap_masked-scaffold_7-processed-gene-6.1-mRNA-1 protein AED:1.00 eAED:1.00 QI:0/-1/0/0/-1/1/1/0/80